MAIFCPVGCAEVEFASGLCSAHYSARLGALANATPELRRLMDEEFTRAWVEMRRGQQDGRSVNRLRAGGVPAALIPALRAMQKTDVTDGAKALAAGELRFLLLLGTAGTGKSVALACACAEVCRRWPWGSMAGGGKPQDAFRFLYASSFEEDVDRESLVRAHMVVIDELGRESPVARARLVDLCIRRHADGRGTGLASNLSAASWKDLYGEPLADRIRADGKIEMLSRKSMRVKNG